MKKGFTLVELSIVLVIIGLLIGGILVGQSLIESAKTTQAVRQLQQYDIAIGQFKNRFKSIPGDSPLMDPPGNGNGQISGNIPGGIPVCGVAFCAERMSFWKHLSDTKMLKDTYINDWTRSNEVGVTSPYFFNQRLDVLHDNDDEGAEHPSGNFYGMYTDPKNDLTPIYIVSIEKKIDDGVATTGNLRHSYNGSDTRGCRATDIVDEDDYCEFAIQVTANGEPLGNPN